MYNNPYFTGYRQNESQPITQNFQLAQPNYNSNIFMARYLKEGEKPQEIFVNNKTAMISLSDKKLYIKETDGNITTYDIVLPLDEKDRKIITLEEEINKLKEMVNNVSTISPTETITSCTELNADNKKHGKK